VLDAGFRDWHLQRGVVSEGLVVSVRDRLTALGQFFDTPQLGNADRGMNVGEVVLEAGVVDFVKP